MARFFVDDTASKYRQVISFELFVGLFKGIGIRSAASGIGFFELGLTNEFNITFVQGGGGEIEIVIRSTVNSGDTPGTTFLLASSDEDLTAAQVEARLFAFRQLYALYVMTEEGMLSELAIVSRNGAGFDSEQRLLPRDLQVRITSLGPGSIVAVATALVKRGKDYVEGFFASFYPEGRRALLDSVRANADLQQINVEQRKFDLNLRRVDSLIRLSRLQNSWWLQVCSL